LSRESDNLSDRQLDGYDGHDGRDDGPDRPDVHAGP
jgi:hypothetical protein